MNVVKDPVAIISWAVCLLAALVYASHFHGPLRGWLDTLVPIAPTGAVASPEALASLAEDHEAEPASFVPAKTPDELMPALKALAAWLELQQSRQGRIVSHMRASRNGNDVILHVTMTEDFRSLADDLQRQILEALSHQWAMRCGDQRVVSNRRFASLEVLSHDGRIIGGGHADVDLRLAPREDG